MPIETYIQAGYIYHRDSVTKAPAVYVVNQGQGSGAGSLSATLQNAAASPGEGAALELSGHQQAVLLVSSTAASFTLQVEGQYEAVSEWFPLAVYALPLYDEGTLITAPGRYLVELASLVALRARLSAVDGGAVTVLAR